MEVQLGFLVNIKAYLYYLYYKGESPGKGWQRDGRSYDRLFVVVPVML